MKFTTAIFFDTSSLRELGWTSAPLTSVLQLSRAGLVDVYLPELVVLERQSHWADAPSQALASARSSLRDLTSNPIIASHHLEQVKNALSEIDKLNLDEMSLAAIERFIHENKIKTIPLSFEQSKAAWTSYFAGKAPYKKAKAREDIPDSHIYEAAKELLQKNGNVHFVCADKRLEGALRKLQGALVYDKLEDVFNRGILKDQLHIWSRDKKWREISHQIKNEDIVAELRSLLEEDLDGRLHDIDFTDEALPGFATVAHVHWALGGELVSIQNPDDWGGGIMSFEVECECDAGIRMRFSHEEAHGLPDWIDIDWGHGGVVHATANVRLKVEATADVEINLSNVESGTGPILERVDFDDPQLFIIKT